MAAPSGVRTRRGLDRFEIAVLCVFMALSLWVVGSQLVRGLSADHIAWTHTDGFFAGDQLQYLAWIQSSAKHFLVSDMFVLRSTPADYFQPAVVISGLLVRAGMASWLALLLWKPVVVVAVFLAVRALVAHSFERTLDRRCALVLGLLFGSLSAVYGSLGIVGDTMLTWLSWGYVYALLAIALIVFALLRYDCERDRGRLSLWPGLIGGAAATVHPWQGELLILILLGAELIRWRETAAGLARWRSAHSSRSPLAALRAPAITLPLVTIVAVAIPLVYYFGLGHFDAVWRMGQQHSKHTYSWTAVAIAIAPLLAVALLGYRGRPDDFVELALRVWLPAAVLIWVLSSSAFAATPLHAVNGITIPLAVLAVKGVRRSPLRRIPRGRVLAGAVVFAGAALGNVYAMAYAHTYVKPTRGNADWITQGESHALDYLASDPTPGGVVNGYYLGQAIPGLTGRQTFVGSCLWSEPNCSTRAITVAQLLNGELPKARAIRFTRDSGARFVLQGCATQFDLRRQLGAMVVWRKRFGCATLYELVPPAPATGPFASAPASTSG